MRKVSALRRQLRAITRHNFLPLLDLGGSSISKGWNRLPSHESKPPLGGFVPPNPAPLAPH
ncbi:hypothetical protein B0T18DRAFT_421299 [Schizothecium vesticola]|uniref:Uncharacterized protein n=1 Tax=Schizothecium vesticola TaxID=314040 RepID=A0AA40BPX5_9PEZI|nr:hypothetical protein B0T18DRAFT_421299 [Schizothecium vesticola]